VGDRVGTLTVWGADAEQACVLESNAVDVQSRRGWIRWYPATANARRAHELLESSAGRGKLVLVP